MNDECNAVNNENECDAIINETRLSYYNVTTRFVDFVGLCQLKQNLV